MSNRAKRRQHRQSAQNRNQQNRNQPGKAKAPPAFTPVPVRTRMDGWTPERQVAFVTALAACACIEDACGAVGMSPRSYYDLRARPGSDSFRQAVEAALDVGTHRLETALLGRAIHGEATPVFYKGEQVGERRRYDNKLGLALLRARAGDRYGAWRDRVQQVREHPDGAALILKEATRRLAEDGRADTAGRQRPQRRPLRSMIVTDVEDDGPPDESERSFSPAWCRRYGFHQLVNEGGDKAQGRGEDEEWEDEPEEHWTDEDWAREEAYARELAAQVAEPGGAVRTLDVSDAYTCPPDGG